MQIKRDHIIILIIFLTYGISVYFIQSIIYPIRYDRLNFLFSELLTLPFTIPIWLNYFFGFGSLSALLLIGKKFFSDNNYLVVGFVYALSPWTVYLLVAQSFYIFILFLFLIIFYSLILIKDDRKYLGNSLLIVSTTVILYSSLLLWAVLPAMLFSSIFLKLISFTKIKYSIVTIGVLILPVIFLSFMNQVGIKNVSANQVQLFSYPGLVNGINVLQGESSISGFRNLSKMSENKYIYIFRYVIFKSIKNLVPATFFTSQEKLLNFSFSPPIYFGFLIPFLYGLYRILKLPVTRKYLLISAILIIPSFLARSLVDLNRLVIFSPVIIFVTSYGLILFSRHQKKLFRFATYITLFLVLIQFLVTQFDISFREVSRYQRVFGQNTEVGKQ